jgi:hypothetical protein
MNKNSLPLVALLTLLAACSSNRPVSRANEPWQGTVAGRPAEIAVRDAIVATDKDLQDAQLYQTRFLTASDGKNGGYVAMVSAFGGEKSYGAPHTWLYRVEGNRLTKQFKFPFAATSLDGGAKPQIKGEYWAYECLMCDYPEAGYMAKIPVKVFSKGKNWRIAADIPRRDRARWSREARLVVKQGLEKYGEDDPEGRRMLKQIDGMFRRGRSAKVPANKTPRLSQENKSSQKNNPSL